MDYIVKKILTTFFSRIRRILINKKEKHVNHLSCEQDNMNANNVHGQPEVNAIYMYQELVECHERLHYDQLR